MGHQISAVLLRGPFDSARAAGFDLRPIELKFGLTLFPLHWSHCDYWADGLAAPGDVKEYPVLNRRVVHQMLHEIAAEPFFAIIETDYFGGNGGQCAVVYRGQEEVLACPRDRRGPINAALRLLGVIAQRGIDEFDTVGLGQYRDWDAMFEVYRGAENACARLSAMAVC
jgi:hypothetical protein